MREREKANKHYQSYIKMHEQKEEMRKKYEELKVKYKELRDKFVQKCNSQQEADSVEELSNNFTKVRCDSGAEQNGNTALLEIDTQKEEAKKNVIAPVFQSFGGFGGITKKTLPMKKEEPLKNAGLLNFGKRK